jgi:hypothetical protein
MSCERVEDMTNKQERMHRALSCFVGCPRKFLDGFYTVRQGCRHAMWVSCGFKGDVPFLGPLAQKGTQTAIITTTTQLKEASL